MATMTIPGTGARRAATRRRAMRGLLLALVLSAGTGCDALERLLTVETPSRLGEERYLVPANAALISRSAVADYECALGAYIVAGGLGAGELVDATQTAARWNYDRRNVAAIDALYSTSACNDIGVYTPINTARYTNDQALQYLESWTDAQVPNRSQLIATNAAFSGFSLLLLGEGFCEGAINIGPPLTSEQLFDTAETRFTRAIEAATTANDQVLLALARMGRARARINQGDAAGAAEDAALVPADFVYSAVTVANDTRRVNRVFQQVNQSNAASVAPAYRTLNDPRVSVTNLNRTAADQVNQLWNQNKYGSLTATLPIASWVEAQLILAEAEGGSAGIQRLNALRGRAGVGLPPLTAEESANFEAALAEERRRELWLQGNRWFDIRRFELAQVPAVGATYPKGGTYGEQRCWPVPDSERLANPNFP